MLNQPTSSPMITRMFGWRPEPVVDCCACATSIALPAAITETAASVVPPSRTLRRLTAASLLLVLLPDLFASSLDICRSCSNHSFAIDLGWRRKRSLRVANSRRRPRFSASARRHLPKKERQGIAAANAKTSPFTVSTKLPVDLLEQSDGGKM